MAHDTISSGIAFAILFAGVGLSFVFVSGNPVTIQRQGWIGFDGIEVTPAIAEALELPGTRGILLTQVTEGSPADKAGLRVGTQGIEVEGRMIPARADVIVAIDGSPVGSREDVQMALAGKQVGDSVRFTIIRDGAERDVNVVIEERPEDAG